MKKLSLAMAVSAALAAGSANAYNVGHVASGLMVPNVIHNGATDTTAVGLVSRDAGTVFWVFFDEDSNHVVDGCFNMTANDQHAFVWAAEGAGAGIQGTRGYLVFTMDAAVVAGNQVVASVGTCDSPVADAAIASGDAIARFSGNAFQVNTSTNDVAFVPAQPLVLNADLDSATADVSQSDYVLPVANARALTGASIQSARLTAVNAADRLDMRYFIDGTANNGNDTFLSFWTADEMFGSDNPAQGASTTNPWRQTVLMYNTSQASTSVNFDLTKRNQNLVDVESIVGAPAFTDGFIQLTLPAAAVGAAGQPGLRTAAGAACPLPYSHDGATGSATDSCIGGVLAYSVVNSTAFGAVQTLLAAHN